MKKSKKKCLVKGRRYYEENKERLQNIAGDRYWRLWEEEKNKEKYARNRYHNMPEYEKQKIKEH